MSLDTSIFNELNQLSSSPFTLILDWIRYIALTWCGGLGLFLLWKASNKWNLVRIFFLIPSVYLVGLILKYLINRPRPAETLESVIVRGDYNFPSFPSNETAVFFAFATILLILFPRRWFSCLTLILAVLVGISRVYLGAHFPSDVLGGATLGVFMPVLYFHFSGSKWRERSEM